MGSFRDMTMDVATMSESFALLTTTKSRFSLITYGHAQPSELTLVNHPLFCDCIASPDPLRELLSCVLLDEHRNEVEFLTDVISLSSWADEETHSPYGLRRLRR